MEERERERKKCSETLSAFGPFMRASPSKLSLTIGVRKLVWAGETASGGSGCSHEVKERGDEQKREFSSSFVSSQGHEEIFLCHQEKVKK